MDLEELCGFNVMVDPLVLSSARQQEARWTQTLRYCHLNRFLSHFAYWQNRLRAQKYVDPTNLDCCSHNILI